MESGTVEIVRGLWASWVDGGRVREFFGLGKKSLGIYRNKLRRTTYVEVSILEAGPDTVASLDFERWEAISLRD